MLFVAFGVMAGPQAEGAVAGPAAVELRVMTLNIFYGGDELNLTNGQFCLRPDGCPETLARVVEAIRAANPDIVGLEEGERNTAAIAGALGWYASERMQIISRYPLIDPPGGDGIYIFVQLAPGRVAALANVHLPADPYGPYLVRDGAPPEEVRTLEESLRLPAIRDRLRVLPGLAAGGIPVFLTGDFNSPSHLDWTEAVSAVRDVVRYPFAWPVSVALANAGFRDSYRRVHPDPVAVPGFTWTPGSPEAVKNEVNDRIDWVLSAGPAAARDSRVVGEAGGPDVEIPFNPWPTDHRGVVSTFDVTPGVAPVMAAVGRGGSPWETTSRLSSTPRAGAANGWPSSPPPERPRAPWRCAPPGPGRRRTARSSSRPPPSRRARTKPCFWTPRTPCCPAVRSGSTRPALSRPSPPRSPPMRSGSRSRSRGPMRRGCAGTGSRSIRRVNPATAKWR